MRRKRFATSLMLFAGYTCLGHAQIARIDQAKLPQDPVVQQTYVGLLALEQYARAWNQTWPYSEPKSLVVAKFTTALKSLQEEQRSDPTNTELRLFTGLVAHLAYNLGIQEGYQPAIDLLGVPLPPGSSDFRPDWFLGIHRCQSNATLAGMNDLLHVEDSAADLPGEFWQDYALCSVVTNMPAHALAAYATAQKLGFVTSSDAGVVDNLRKRFKATSVSETYASHVAWEAAQSGNAVVRFTSTLCGESFVTGADWPIDVRDVKDGACVVEITGPDYPSRGGNSAATILLLSQPAATESLEAFTQRMMKSPRYADRKPYSGLACPVSECLAFEVLNKRVYSQHGGAHLLALSFATEEPEYPGLGFEHPQPLPSLPTTGEPQAFRATDTLRRFPGTRYTFLLLDANEDIFGRAHIDFENLLKSLTVDHK